MSGVLKVNLSDSEIAELDSLLKRMPKPKLMYLTEAEWETLKGKFDQLAQM